MIHGVKYFEDDVNYVSRTKHFCPNCKTQLETVKVSRVINKKSPEAKEFDFSLGHDFLVGNIKFIWKEFECPNCKKHLTVNEMRKIEGIAPPIKKTGNNTKDVILFLLFSVAFMLIVAIVKKYFL